MKTLTVTHQASGGVLATEAQAATGFFSRLAGLAGRKTLEPGREALVLYPCRSVHTFFMRFDLDLLYLDRRGRVIESVSALPPGRSGPLVRQAALVLELPAGVIDAHGIRRGDLILFNGSEDLVAQLT